MICPKCTNDSNKIFRHKKSGEIICEDCRKRLKLESDDGYAAVPIFTSHQNEVEDVLKMAKWNVTGGFRLWCKFEAKNMTLKDQHIEEDKRLEHYVKLRLEKELLSRGIFDPPITINKI